MRFISYKLFPWVAKGKVYALELVVPIIKINSLIILIITTAKVISILYSACYILGTVLSTFRMIVSRI